MRASRVAGSKQARPIQSNEIGPRRNSSLERFAVWRSKSDAGSKIFCSRGYIYLDTLTGEITKTLLIGLADIYVRFRGHLMFHIADISRDLLLYVRQKLHDAPPHAQSASQHVTIRPSDVTDIDTAAEAGRDADAIEVSIFFCPPDPDTVKRFADAGITRVPRSGAKQGHGQLREARAVPARSSGDQLLRVRDVRAVPGPAGDEAEGSPRAFTDRGLDGG